MKLRLINALCGVTLLASSLSALALESDRLVQVKHGQLHVIQTGKGPHTVIFESGFASDLSEWNEVVHRISKHANVVLYSRANNGRSPTRETALTLSQHAQELDEMIVASQLKGPFIFVAHSYGGFVLRHYAGNHPDQVAGMIFIDPATEEIYNELKKIDADRVQLELKRFAQSAPAQWRGDVEQVQRIFDAGQLPQTPALPQVPTSIVSSLRPDARGNDISLSAVGVAIKRNLHNKFFQQFTSGSHILTHNSGHFIQKDEPQLVANAIEATISVVDQERQMAEARAAKQKAQAAVMQALELAAEQVQQQHLDAARAGLSSTIHSVNLTEAHTNSLGYNLLKAQQLALAELLFSINAQRFPESDNAQDSYGEILFKQGKFEAAIQSFTSAIRLGRVNPQRSPAAILAYEKNLNAAKAAIR